MLNGTKDHGFSQAPRANIIGIINNNLNKIIMGNYCGNYCGKRCGNYGGKHPKKQELV